MKLLEKLRAGCVRSHGDIDQRKTEELLSAAADAIERAIQYAEYVAGSRIHPQHKRGVYVMESLLRGEDP